MKQFYTYLHCKPNGAPFYVGKGCDSTHRRSHDFYKRNIHHKNIVAKYGRETILVYVFPCDSEQQAFNDEIQQIAQLKSEGHTLCNMTDGGEGVSGAIISEETRIKMSIASTGRHCGKIRSLETRVKIAASQVGNTKALGHKCSLRTRAHWSETRKGKPWTATRREAQLTADGTSKSNLSKRKRKNVSL